MIEVTVLTPTYNRKHCLQRLFYSLNMQNCPNFEWIIVDDGSNDGTRDTVKKMENQSTFEIKYIYQENGGKHRALNVGIKKATGKLVFIVDSDDYLPLTAIEDICKIGEKYNIYADPNIIGIIGMRGTKKENNISQLTKVGKKKKFTTLYDFYFRLKGSGDTALVYKTDILKKNLFKEFEDEKFLSENSLYFCLDHLGKMVLCSKILYYNDYQVDGLTANYRKLLKKNPKGTAYMYYVYSITAHTVWKKILYQVNANYYNRLVQENVENKDEVSYDLAMIVRFGGWILYKLRRRYF